MPGIVRSGGIGIPGLGPLAKGVLPFEYQAVEFNRDEFTKLLHDHGYPIIWEKALPCPNRKGIDPKDHNINCTFCENTGWIYVDSEETRALITGLKITESFYAFGRFDGSSVMITLLPEYQINYWDRITLLQGTAVFQELITRKKVGLKDTLKYTPIAISYVYWKNRAGALTAFAATDYQISGNQIEWLVNKPDIGDYFAIRYTYRPRYVFTNLPHQLRDQTIKGSRVVFPLQAIGQLDFMVRDESKDTRELEAKDPFSER